VALGGGKMVQKPSRVVEAFARPYFANIVSRWRERFAKSPQEELSPLLRRELAAAALNDPRRDRATFAKDVLDAAKRTGPTLAETIRLISHRANDVSYQPS
jgi:hypothetical protein